MSPFDVIVIVAVSVAFLAVVGVIVYKKITNKGGGCGCGCEGCPHACNCGGNKKDKSAKGSPSEK